MTPNGSINCEEEKLIFPKSDERVRSKCLNKNILGDVSQLIKIAIKFFSLMLVDISADDDLISKKFFHR